MMYTGFFPIPYSLFPIPYSLFPIPYSLFPIPCSLKLPNSIKVTKNYGITSDQTPVQFC
ncbi:MAG: hypothetical protein F6J90_21450 [Moorea sp. SIOASIH]|uniref:hypothetical protein n=1 Tax=Moorena sp. SIOASIH TaxID=2607817 RepID=UPI0013B5BFEC|nr:hypothetical protein [Moorena sp. SIOASIH]NEO38758.1 hypothetical protein [Moorena sp. SIOASIH]